MSDGATIRKFKNGEVIFTEGEPSGSAYVIVKGAVELTKNSKHGPVRLASLKAGELFGEMGVIDGSPRSATSRAIGATTLKEIAPEALLKGIQSDPDLSSKVMTKLVERLRTADEMLAKAGVSVRGASARSPSVKPSPAVAAPKKKGFFSRLFGGAKGRQAVFEILVADFFDDEENQTTGVFYEALKAAAEKTGGGLINVRRTSAPFSVFDFSDTPMTWGQMKSAAQRWLRELEGDLLIWGQVRSRGKLVHLRMAQVQPLRQERAGFVSVSNGVDLPVELDDVLISYLYGVALGAMVPANRDQLEAMEGILGPALDGARAALQKRIRDFDPDEQARFECALANLLAACGVQKKRTDRLKEAEDGYLRLLRSLRRPKTDILPGLVYRHLGYTQAAWFDLGGEKDLLGAAVESFREACTYFTKELFPNEWADLQAMIGQLLFKKDHLGDDDVALRESIAAYQSALQVFSASTAPYRWGEAKHHLARALQLLGSQTGDLDMIARSAEACREALAVRSKTHTPMLWAATQNNLGSALFMLCQKTRKPETAEAAVKAFQAALEVYEVRKAAKLAQVTQKNLARAQEVSINLGPMKPTAQEDDTLFDEAAFDEESIQAEGEVVDDAPKEN